MRDGVVSERRLAEIAVQEMLEVDQVTDRKRLVEPVVLLEGLDGGRIAGSLLTEVRRDGVARDELGQNERDERDPEQEQDERAEPAQDEEQERAARAEPRAPADGKDRLGFGAAVIRGRLLRLVRASRRKDGSCVGTVAPRRVRDGRYRQ